jgi:hypothetical protein
MKLNYYQYDFGFQVPNDKKLYPLVDPDLYSWTALSFAVSKRHLQICHMLLDAGANVDGAAALTDISIRVETPLQLAVTGGLLYFDSCLSLTLSFVVVCLLLFPIHSGNYDIVSLLCARKADINVTFPLGVGKLGFSNPFAASAAIGYRKILRKLLAEAPSIKEDQMMSLEEILAEGD